MSSAPLDPLELARRIAAEQQVTADDGSVHRLSDELSPEEGDALFSAVSADDSVRNTLEVGCAFGLSSLYLCAGLRGRPGARHRMLDPFQHTNYHGIGVRHLRQCGLEFAELVEEVSEFALPRLAATEAGALDLVLIDGWHTLDHTLLDAFYANRLLRVGGYLVIDDLDMLAIRWVFEYLASYPCYDVHQVVTQPRPRSWRNSLARAVLAPFGGSRLQQHLSRPTARRLYTSTIPSLGILRKVADDQRNWNWAPEGL